MDGNMQDLWDDLQTKQRLDHDYNQRVATDHLLNIDHAISQLAALTAIRNSNLPAGEVIQPANPTQEAATSS